MQSVFRAKASKVYLVEQAMMAALGAGLPITEPTGSMVVDIGAAQPTWPSSRWPGSSTAGRIRVGGNRMDEEIVRYIKRKYNLLIGKGWRRISSSASVRPPPGGGTHHEDQRTRPAGGDARTLVISDTEIREALSETVSHIIDAVRVALEQTPPELSADIMDKESCSPGRRAPEEPGQADPGRDKSARDHGRRSLASVVLGAGKLLEDLDLLRKVAVDVS